jgi:hypothetical protein
VLSNPAGTGLHLGGTGFWHLTGFTVADSTQGIVLDSSSHNILDGVEVTGVAGEGVLLGGGSSDNVVRRAWVHHSGVGLALAAGSDRNQVLDGRFGPEIAAAYLDVREGTAGGVVGGNTFDGPAVAAWVAVKGNGYAFTGNAGSGAAPAGYAVAGCGNVWRDNRSDLGGAGEYAIAAGQADCAGNPNVVYASNTVTGATKGLTDIPVTVN